MTKILPATTVPADVRRSRILSRLRAEGFVRVVDLAETLGVSEVTIRSDLDAMQLRHAVRRIRGGAMVVSEDPDPSGERGYDESVAQYAEEKRRIGTAAAALVSSGDTVILDVGSTTGAVASALAARSDLADVVIVTNSLSHALTLEPIIPRCTVIVTGGTLRPRQHSLVEPFASRMISTVHAQIAIIGCTGVDATTGFTNVNMPEAELKRLMVHSCERAVVVADSSKMGRTDSGIIGQIGEASVLVTDVGARALTPFAAIEAVGIEVIAV